MYYFMFILHCYTSTMTHLPQKKPVILFILENEKGIMMELMCNVQIESMERKMAVRKEK